jgi:DNA-binding LytR/AlgR family response regulator
MIVEDEPLARNLLTDYVNKVSYLHLLKACDNPLEAIELLREHSVDLLFLDIQMPEITGLTMLKILQRKPLVVLTTAYSEYALQGYEHDVLDYLLKPVTFERFLKAVEKAVNRLQTSLPDRIMEHPLIHPDTEPDFIFVKDGTRFIKVKLSDILYIEGLKDYVSIYTPDKKIVTLQTLKTLESQLSPLRFARIHNSYIVALAAIEAIDKDQVQIGDVFLPISDTYRKAFRELIGRNQL